MSYEDRKGLIVAIYIKGLKFDDNYYFMNINKIFKSMIAKIISVNLVVYFYFIIFKQILVKLND